MLVEIWERLRGYDKWIQTEAKFESSELKRIEHVDENGIAYDTYESSDVLVWPDQQGENQRAYFTVPADSPLYQCIDGESIEIRYNPIYPDEYYLRELLQTRIHAVVRRVVVTLLMICFLTFFVWLGARNASH